MRMILLFFLMGGETEVLSARHIATNQILFFLLNPVHLLALKSLSLSS